MSTHDKAQDKDIDDDEDDDVTLGAAGLGGTTGGGTSARGGTTGTNTGAFRKTTFPTQRPPAPDPSTTLLVDALKHLSVDVGTAVSSAILSNMQSGANPHHTPTSTPGTPSTRPKIQRRETNPPILSEVDPIQWTTFKKCFERIAKMNDWTPDTAVLKLSTCIRDSAARTIDHLKWDTFVTLEAAMQAIEKVFLNPAAIEFHKATFKSASRNAQETLIQWHTRGRELFMRAYPDIIDFDRHADLKDKFVLGIRDRVLSTQLKASDTYETMSYTEVLTKAQRLQGSALIVHHAYTGKSMGQESVQAIHEDPKADQPAVHAIQNRKTMKCFHCNKEGHGISDCTLHQKSIDRIRADPGRYNLQLAPGTSASSYPRGRPNTPRFQSNKPNDRFRQPFRSPRPSGQPFRRDHQRNKSFRGKGRFPNRRSINAIEGPDPYDNIEEHYDECPEPEDQGNDNRRD